MPRAKVYGSVICTRNQSMPRPRSTSRAEKTYNHPRFEPREIKGKEDKIVWEYKNDTDDDDYGDLPPRLYRIDSTAWTTNTFRICFIDAISPIDTFPVRSIFDLITTMICTRPACSLSLSRC